ncbi:MAG: hypothetical protein MRJ96_00365 [Nitrospirales bacterium]|nr:hypothetical protein [Nitrospira sp.]MDR4499892.1 hypothetical protein [Nitrospirales bacterium]
MPTTHVEPLPLWSVIFTGDEQHSTHPSFQHWFGQKKPTPFYTFVGSRSMLQHTWDRADQLSHPNCKITIVAKSYLHEVCTQLGGRVPGIIITEPRHRGRVVSLFLALTYLQIKEPRALVVFYPSDHFIYPENLFLKTVQRMIWSTERFPDHIFIIGATETASRQSEDGIVLDQPLGWTHGYPLYGVKGLAPASEQDTDEYPPQTAILANTSVLAAQVDVLWNLGWDFFPQMMDLFDELQDAIETSYEQAVLERIFQHPKIWEISLSSLLQLAPQLAVIELEKVLWSDWAKPQQILENMAEIGKQPTFPLEYTRDARAWHAPWPQT